MGNRLVDKVGEGEGRTNGESSTETYILPCVKQFVGSCCIAQGTEPGAL